jgi:hypothetical protein
MEIAGNGICHIDVGFPVKLMIMGLMFQASNISLQQHTTAMKTTKIHHILSNQERFFSAI